MKKRGISQIDWVISLALFLLYVAWFFIFIRPMALQQNTLNVVDLVADKIQQEAYWTVLNYPIIIKSDFSMQNEPIAADVSFASQQNLFMANKSFFLSSGKLFFLSSFSPGTTIAYVSNSNETYESFSQITDLSAGNQSASAGGLSADFQNNILSSADFDGLKIFSYLLSSDGRAINSTNSSFISNTAMAIYQAATQRLNETTIIFGYNPRIYTLFSGNSRISESFEIFRYQNYYLSSSNRGSVNSGGCYAENSAVAEFYTDTSVMLVVLSSPAEMSFCGANQSISLDIRFNASGNVLQKIMFYEGSPDDFIKYQNAYSARLGIPESTTALSLFSLKLLNITNYDALKARWNIGDFRVYVSNTTTNERIIEFGGIPYEKATVYAKETRDFLLDKYGNLDDVKISIQSWT